MVSKVQKDGADWYECDTCGLLFDSQDDARDHEANCDDSGPPYLQ